MKLTASTQGWVARRSFLSRASAGAAAFAAAFGGVSTAAAEASDWKPARHAEDDWFEPASPAKHRFFLDTTDPGSFGQAIAWSRNFLEASTSGYGLTDADAALIICARHASTAFAYTDAMWAKYGDVFSERSDAFVDPKTKQTPAINVFLTSGYGAALRNTDITLDAVLKRGVRLAVCGMATRRIAGLVAKKHGLAQDDVFKELSEHLVANARIVPAGIVAVSRAQEHQYTVATVA